MPKVVTGGIDPPPKPVKTRVSPLDVEVIVEKKIAPAALPVAAVGTVVPVSVNAIRRRKTPLEYLYDVMANRKVPWATRVRAMIGAAEYVHAKQPQAIHVRSETRLEAVIVHVEQGPWTPAALPAAADTTKEAES